MKFNCTTLFAFCVLVLLSVSMAVDGKRAGGMSKKSSHRSTHASRGHVRKTQSISKTPKISLNIPKRNTRKEYTNHKAPRPVGERQHYSGISDVPHTVVFYRQWPLRSSSDSWNETPIIIRPRIHIHRSNHHDHHYATDNASKLRIDSTLPEDQNLWAPYGDVPLAPIIDALLPETTTEGQQVSDPTEPTYSGAVICVPMMFREEEPTTSEGFKEVQKTVCYPAKEEVFQTTTNNPLPNIELSTEVTEPKKSTDQFGMCAHMKILENMSKNLHGLTLPMIDTLRDLGC